MAQTTFREEAKTIYEYAIRASRPDVAVRNILSDISLGAGRVVLIAVGKAAWTMADTACRQLGSVVSGGIVITKYRHSQGPVGNLTVWEAGHPVLDENSFAGAQKAIREVQNLRPDDTVLFLLSGGGSSLFELSELPLAELQDISRQLLACGAQIQEINCVRKHLSQIKGGRFAALCAPAQVVTVVLSDIIDDDLAAVASGPTCPDPTTSRQALEVVEKYGLRLSEQAKKLLERETPKQTRRCTYFVCGSVRQLCRAAAEACRNLGYESLLLTDQLNCIARDAGSFLGSIARTHAQLGRKCAFIAGGETVVRLTGTGKGGRNQELALAAAEQIAGLSNVAVFSVGSDGTDGPTDAAGGFVDGSTRERLQSVGLTVEGVLRRNDAYHALQAADGLIFTGPTGTNVNDVSVVLIDGGAVPSECQK